MRVAVVILNWNGARFLNEFLPSVVKYTPRALAEVVVVDNGSEDNSLELLSSDFKSVRVIKLDRNYGFTGGYNRGLVELGEFEFFLLLNSDVAVSEGYLEPLVNVMDSDSTIAAAQPKILSYTKPEYFEYAGAAGGMINFLGFPYCRGRVMSRVEKDNGQYNKITEIFWASGAAMFVRSGLYLSSGGLDEDFFAHMEEIDFCWRLKNKGYKIMSVPQSSVYHLGGGTLPNNSPYKLFLNFRNSLFMLYKNLTPFKLFPILFMRMCVDGVIGVAYLCQGKFTYFKAVIKAHFAFYKEFRVLREKRKMLRHGF